MLDASTKEIVSTAKRTGANVTARSASDPHRSSDQPFAACGQEEPRAVRDAHLQASSTSRDLTLQTVDALMKLIWPQVDVFPKSLKHELKVFLSPLKENEPMRSGV